MALITTPPSGLRGVNKVMYVERHHGRWNSLVFNLHLPICSYHHHSHPYSNFSSSIISLPKSSVISPSMLSKSEPEAILTAGLVGIYFLTLFFASTKSLFRSSYFLSLFYQRVLLSFLHTTSKSPSSRSGVVAGNREASFCSGGGNANESSPYGNQHGGSFKKLTKNRTLFGVFTQSHHTMEIRARPCLCRTINSSQCMESAYGVINQPLKWMNEQ